MKLKLPPKCLNKIKYKNPFKSSTRGYCGEIGSPQYLHFPFWKVKLNTGISSYHFKGVLQFGQWEDGKTIDSSLGILYIHTFKNEPMIVPMMNINICICSLLWWFLIYETSSVTSGTQENRPLVLLPCVILVFALLFYQCHLSLLYLA